MQSRKRDHSDYISFDVGIPVHLKCHGCKAPTTVTLDLDDFEIDHTNWEIRRLSNSKIEYALERSHSPFKLCSLIGRNKGDAGHLRLFCPLCMETKEDLILIEDEYE